MKEGKNMYCTFCHAENDNNAAVCKNCGAPLYADASQQQPMYAPMEKKYSNTMPIVSVILALLNFNILGIILSVLSLKNYNIAEGALFVHNLSDYEKYGRKSRKLSKAAIVITVILMILRPLFVMMVFVVGADSTGIFGDGGLIASDAGSLMIHSLF